ncbi:MAG: hypothetical protein JF609_01810 [Verrucomicrobia bacterium]|nr:hypothetical protein [Verrucomicrobiota bacterium]
MKNQIAADGLGRFLEAKQKARTSGSIYEKYAAELASASPEEKKKLQERIQREISVWERTLNHKPSAGTLW